MRPGGFSFSSVARTAAAPARSPFQPMASSSRAAPIAELSPKFPARPFSACAARATAGASRRATAFCVSRSFAGYSCRKRRIRVPSNFRFPPTRLSRDVSIPRAAAGGETAAGTGSCVPMALSLLGLSSIFHSASGAKGLARWASIPASRSCFALASPVCAVSATIRVRSAPALSSFRMARAASLPSISGISTSSSTTSKESRPNAATASRPFRTANTVCPFISKKAVVTSRFTSKSSASKIRNRRVCFPFDIGGVTPGTAGGCCSGKGAAGAALSVALADSQRGNRNQNRVPP
jgi:hypothetical protein